MLEMRDYGATREVARRDREWPSAGAPTDGSAWLRKEEHASRVIRGGSWSDYPRNCRSAYRGSYSPDTAYNSDIGFRVVCSAS